MRLAVKDTGLQGASWYSNLQSGPPDILRSSHGRAMAGNVRPMIRKSSSLAVWTRPTPDRDADFIKPSYIPSPAPTPIIQPSRREDAPLYSPSGPEFAPPDRQEQPKELPEGPKMPERRPDPIPAGTPKEKPPTEPEKREAPPPKQTEPAPKK